MTDAALSQTGKIAYLTFIESGSAKNYTGSLWKSDNTCSAFSRLPWIPVVGSEETIIGVATSADGQVVYVSTFTAGTRNQAVNFRSGSIYCSLDGGATFEKKTAFESNRFQENGSGNPMASYLVIENRIQVACSADGKSVCALYYVAPVGGSNTVREPVVTYSRNFGKTWKTLKVGFSELNTVVGSETTVKDWTPRQYKLIMNRSILDNVE